MKSFSKRVLSFSMAAAMVLSTAVVSPVDAQAASVKMTASTSKITAGKTYSAKIKGLTKNQYVKFTKVTAGETVKIGTKKIKKGTKVNGTGKTLTVKIKTADKIKNYSSVVKAQVYNKKTNKKVGKELSVKRTVKCTKLAINSVEPATLASQHKYVVVNFNRKLDSLDPSEVSIREKDTNSLVQVESVALAKNGKSATLTLLGDKNAAGTRFVEANTDYVLVVEQNSVTASIDFSFPDVAAGVVITATDASKRTISIGSIKFTVPTTTDVDFQEILGRTATFTFDKNNEVVKFNLAKEEVKYGAFASKLENGVYTLSSKTTDDKYVTVSGNATISDHSNIYNTTRIKVGSANLPADGPVYYAKLVLNPNGTIRTIVYLADATTNVLVASVAGNVVTESKSVAVNLKDYTILKEGKTIAVTDIQAGDVVLYNAGAKFAEVYNTKVSGAVSNVTDAKITINSTEYKYPTAKYIDNNESKKADAKYFSALKKAAKDATVYLNRFGEVVYATGDQGVEATSTRELVVKGTTKAYKQGLESFIKLDASDATETAVPEIKLSDLKTVVVNGTKYTKDDDANANTIKLKSFDEFTFDNSTNVLREIVATKKDSPNNKKDQNIKFAPDRGDVITLTLDSTNTKVVGVEVESVSTAKCVSTNAAFEKGKSLIKDTSNVDYQIVSSTPIYEITKDAASVTKTTYGEYTKKSKETYNKLIKLYVNGGNVKKVVIDNSSNQVYTVTDNADVYGVVTVCDTLEGKNVKLTVMSEGTAKDFTSFADGAPQTPVTTGSIVKVTYDKNTGKVSAIVIVSGSEITTKTYTTKAAAVSGDAIANGKIDNCELATSITPTIVMKDGDSWKVITYGELSDIAATTDYNHGKKLVVKYRTMAAKVIDYVVVEVQ